MYVILREKQGAVFDDDLMDIYELAGFVESDAAADLVAIRKTFGDGLLISEEITRDFDAIKSTIPGELNRAIDAWNAMTTRVNIHIDKVEERERFILPFRKWKKKLGKRSYLLESLAADVEAQPYLWPTIRFGWLLRTTGVEFNSEKVHARAYAKTNGNGNGKISEAAYVQLARRVSDWQRDKGGLYVGGGDSSEAFERDIGMSWAAFARIKAQFNGAHP